MNTRTWLGHLAAGTLLFLSSAASAAEDDAALFSNENLALVVEAFDRANKGGELKTRCDCITVQSVTEETSNQFPAPKYRTVKVVAQWMTEDTGGFVAAYYLAHEVGTDNSTWYGHHLKFGMKPFTVPTLAN